MQLPFLRVGVPGEIAISLGRSQRHLTPQVLPSRYRTSGGGAVLLGPWLLRAMLVLPRSHAWLCGGPARAAQTFGDVHQQWLARMGIETVPYTGPLVDHWACFAGRAPGELMADGAKITGISQTWRRRRALLWSGTLLRPVPWSLLIDAFGQPQEAAQALRAAAVDAQELSGSMPDSGAWSHALRDALAGAMARQPECSVLR